MSKTLSTGELLKATEVDSAAFQTWIRRGDITFAADNMQGGAGAGNHRRFSLHAYMHFFVGVELLNSGLDAKVAFEAAAKFAYFGRFEEGNLPIDNRRVGLPYHYTMGQTLLIVPGGNASMAEVIAVEHDNLCLSDVPEIDGRAMGFVALNVSKVWDRAMREIGENPDRELDLAYSVVR